MTTTTAPRPHDFEVTSGESLKVLAIADARRFARHPVFLASCAIILTFIAVGLAKQQMVDVGVEGTVIPAFFIGVFGFVPAHRLTTSLRRSGDLADTAPVGIQRRTASMCLACLVPMSLGVLCRLVMVVLGAVWPPHMPDDGRVAWFGYETDVTIWAVLVSSVILATLGGPLLGVAVARWAPFRGSALLGVVGLLIGTMVLLGLPSPWYGVAPWVLFNDEEYSNGAYESTWVVDAISPRLELRICGGPLCAGRGRGDASRQRPTQALARCGGSDRSLRSGLPRHVDGMRLRTWSGWPTAVSAAIAVGLLLALIALNHGRELPLFVVQLDLLVLVAGAAYLLDDVAKSVTDVVPISLLRRRGVIVAQGLRGRRCWLVDHGLALGWLTPTEPLAFLSWEVAGVSCMAVAMAVRRLSARRRRARKPGGTGAGVGLHRGADRAAHDGRDDPCDLDRGSGQRRLVGADHALLAALTFVLSSRRVWRPKSAVRRSVTEGSKERVDASAAVGSAAMKPHDGSYSDHDVERFLDEPSRSGRPTFERDRARIVHSAGLRRLAAKTQVVGSVERRLHPQPAHPHPRGRPGGPRPGVRPGLQSRSRRGRVPRPRPRPPAVRPQRRTRARRGGPRHRRLRGQRADVPPADPAGVQDGRRATAGRSGST